MLFHNQKGSNSQVFNSKKKSTPDWTNPWIVLKQNQMKNQYLLWKKNSFSPLGSSGNGDLDKKIIPQILPPTGTTQKIKKCKNTDVWA